MPQSDSASMQIDGHEFKVYMLPPRIALAVLADLGNLLGPSLAVIASDGQDESDDSNEAEVSYAQAMAEFFKHYNSAKGQEIIDKLASRSSVDGKELKQQAVFDDVFSGKIGLMFKWATFAIRTQYADFFEQMGVGFGNQLQAK